MHVTNNCHSCTDDAKAAPTAKPLPHQSALPIAATQAGPQGAPTCRLGNAHILLVRQHRQRVAGGSNAGPQIASDPPQNRSVHLGQGGRSQGKKVTAEATMCSKQHVLNRNFAPPNPVTAGFQGMISTGTH